LESSKINLYGYSKYLSGTEPIPAPIECKSNLYVQSGLPGELNLINCNGNNLGFVALNIPGFPNIAFVSDSLYCQSDSTLSGSTTEGTACIDPRSREEFALYNSRFTELSTNIESEQDVADPVNIATGEFTYDNTVMSIPGRGMPFNFSLSYKNQATTASSPVGNNFDHSYNKSLVAQTN
jgi:Domain of unknown function (DUF6531)